MEMATSNQPRASGKFERLALLYSDGSIGILPADCTLNQAESEARFLEAGEHDHLASIALVRLEVLDTLVDGTAK
jgi:hypothetical protein